MVRQPVRKTTFLYSINDCFRPILVVDDNLIPPGTVFSRVANNRLYMVLLQLTTETARIMIETQVGFDAQDGHRALVALANFYAPMNDGRVDELTFKSASMSAHRNFHLYTRESQAHCEHVQVKQCPPNHRMLDQKTTECTEVRMERE